MRIQTILFFLMAFLIHCQTGYVQTLKSTKFSFESGTISSRDCNSRDPGTVSFGPILGQSNDARPDTIFLCYGDQMFIQNNGDGDFNTGDPNPSTPSAVGFLLYGCQPTVNGNDFAAIDGDCNLTNPPPPANELWYFMGTPNGDLTLYNEGTVNTTHNAGSPFTLWLAPATFDAFTTIGGEYYGQYEDNGSCIKVNTSAAFPVVYLNEIQITNYQTNGPSSLSGLFNTVGGLPEFNSGYQYTVTMVNKNNSSIVANIIGQPFEHTGEVRFAVPVAGTYIITVSDGKNCATTKEVVIPQGQMEISGASGSVAMGDIVCLDFTVKNFLDMIGGQFSINFNPNLLEYDHIEFPTPNPLNMNMSHFGVTEAANGVIRTLWFTSGFSGITVPDNNVIFSICFKAIGPPGTMTPVIITSTPLPAEFENEDGLLYTIDNTPGIVTIVAPTELQIILEVCSTTTSAGSISITPVTPSNVTSVNITFNNGLPDIINSNVATVYNGLLPGTYRIEIWHPNWPGTIDTTVIIANSPPINALALPNNPGCFNSRDGSITINPQGGTPPYSVQWSTFQFNVHTISGLANGSYSVTLTDQLGCVAVENIILNTQPMALEPATIVSPSCSGSMTGSIRVRATGGNPSAGGTYDYSWSYNNVQQLGAVEGVLTNIPEGTYFVTITDANGCNQVATFTLTPGVQLSIDTVLSEPLCYGDRTAEITVTGQTGGTPAGPYTFAWSAGVGTPVNTTTTSTVSNLAGGIYDITVTDQSGCSVTETIDVSGPGEIQLIAIGKVDDNCSGPSSGRLTLFVNGNAVPFPDPNDPTSGFYRFTWSDGSNPVTVDAVNLQLTNLEGAGGGKEYFVTITDVNGCSVDTSFFINKQDAPGVTFDTLTAIACAGGNNGSIQANIQAFGSPITTVTWSSNAGTPVNSGNQNGAYQSMINNLSGGTYVVTIHTQSGCVVVDSVTLESSGSLLIDAPIIVPASCDGVNDGSISINPLGGVPPYTYNWTNGATTPQILNLLPGSYTVTITDGSSCPAFTQTFIVPSQPSIVSQIDVTSIQPAACFDASVGTGAATINASGGTSGNYTFVWTSGESNTGTASTAVGLHGGWQYVSITDGGCTIVDSVFIPSPPAIVVDDAQSTWNDVTCYGDQDGAISIIATGGNGGFSYNWSPAGPASPQLSNLGPGTYFVTITDSQNCIGRDSFSILSPEELIATLNPSGTNDILCFGTQTGSITVQTTGGNGTNSYTWSPALAGNVNAANNLPAGNYAVTVTDQKGCNDIVTTTLTEPQALAVDFGPIANPQCAGYETNFEINTISGGEGPDYRYTIDNGIENNAFATVQILGGTHLLTIIDENGCRLDTTFTVADPAPIIVTLPEEVGVNLGDSVLLSPSILSPFPVSTISWTPSGNVSCTNCDATYASSIDNQFIVVTVTDANGCIGTDSTLLIVDKTRKLFIPNAFSPNKDGINDLFQAYTGPGVKQIDYIRVFNRWGALVYEETSLPPSPYGAGDGWDGTFNGQLLTPAVFTYVTKVVFDDDRSLLYFGTVTLIR